MRHPLRRCAAVIAAVVLVGACGQTESNTSDDRDRNAPMDPGASDVDFGVNGNGVAVNALWDDRETVIGGTRTVTLNDLTTVYSVVSVIDKPKYSWKRSDLDPVEFKVAKIDSTSGQPMFEKTYGLKTMKLTPSPTTFDKFIPTRNGYGIYVVANKSGTTTGPTMRRYRLDTGQPDTAFGTKGVVSLPSLGQGLEPEKLEIVDVADEPDGRMVVLVVAGNANYLLRMNTKGILDQNFGGGGAVAIPLEFGDLRLQSFARVLLWTNTANQRIVSLVGFVQRYADDGAFVARHVMDLRVSSDGVVDGAYVDQSFNAIQSGWTPQIPAYSELESAFVDFSGKTARQLSDVGIRGIGGPPVRVNVSCYFNCATGGLSVMVAEQSSTSTKNWITNEPTVFTDNSRAFSPDEKRMWNLTQFSTQLALYNIGIVHNRASNFSGLAIGRSDYGSFDLYDVLRVTEYGSDTVLASKIVTNPDGSIRFTMTGLTTNGDQGVSLEENDIGLAQATWGVGMTANGLPVKGFGGDSVWAKNPVTVDYLSSYFVNQDSDQLKRAMTLMGEDNTMYLIETLGDGWVPTIRAVDLVKGSLGASVNLTGKSWFMSGLPPNPDAMEIRDGYLYVAANFSATPAGATVEWPWVSGVARYSLSTGAMDESFGVEGVVPLNDAWNFPRNRVLILHDDGSFHVTFQFLEDDGSTILTWKNPTKVPSLNEWFDNPPQPTKFRFVSDIYSDDTEEGSIGYTVDADGRLVIARVRLSRDWIEGTTTSTMRIWRFLSNGQPDDNFGVGGLVEADLAGWSKVSPAMGFNFAPQVAVTKDQKLLIGFFGKQLLLDDNNKGIGYRRVHVLARLMPDGTMDALKGPEPTPVLVAMPGPVGGSGGTVAGDAFANVATPPLPAPATEALVPIVEKLDPAPVVIPTPTPAAEVAKPVDTTQPGAPAKSEIAAEAVAATPQTPQLKIIAMTSAVDRSIGVKWAIPETLVGKSVTYDVTAQPGGKVCSTASTLCVFRGLAPWTAYTFSVAVKTGATGISASDSSTPLKPVRILARNKATKTANLLTPATPGKLQWKVAGGCTLSDDFAMLTTPKDATTCILSVRSPKKGKTPAITRSITIDVRAVVN